MRLARLLDSQYFLTYLVESTLSFDAETGSSRYKISSAQSSGLILDLSFGHFKKYFIASSQGCFPYILHVYA